MEQSIHITLRYNFAIGKVNLNVEEGEEWKKGTVMISCVSLENCGTMGPTDLAIDLSAWRLEVKGEGVKALVPPPRAISALSAHQMTHSF